jgi:acyl-CoA thioesterase-1
MRIIVAALACGLGTRLGSADLTVSPKPAAAPVDPAFAPIVDDPALPRVLLIGDSVSIGYTLAVRRELAGTVWIDDVKIWKVR